MYACQGWWQETQIESLYTPVGKHKSDFKYFTHFKCSHTVNDNVKSEVIKHWEGSSCFYRQTEELADLILPPMYSVYQLSAAHTSQYKGRENWGTNSCTTSLSVMGSWSRYTNWCPVYTYILHLHQLCSMLVTLLQWKIWSHIGMLIWGYTQKW